MRERIRIWTENCAACRWVADRLTCLCLVLIEKLNPSRDRILARRLRVLGNQYDTRPREEGEE